MIAQRGSVEQMANQEVIHLQVMNLTFTGLNKVFLSIKDSYMGLVSQVENWLFWAESGISDLLYYLIEAFWMYAQ